MVEARLKEEAEFETAPDLIVDKGHNENAGPGLELLVYIDPGDPGAADLRLRARLAGLHIVAKPEEANALLSATAGDYVRKPNGRLSRAKIEPRQRLVGPGSNPEKDPGGFIPSPANRIHLTKRELGILEYLADGWSNEEIASVLRLSKRTIRFYLESIYQKFGVHRRGEAVREALQRGFITLNF